MTNASDVTAIFTQAKETLGRVDVVFNGAGYSLVGEFEGVSEDDARKMFDVNVWGAARVAKAAAAFMRDVNSPQGGRIITISSTTAITPFPASSYYNASKAGK